MGKVFQIWAIVYCVNLFGIFAVWGQKRRSASDLGRARQSGNEKRERMFASDEESARNLQIMQIWIAVLMLPLLPVVLIIFGRG